MAFRRCAKCDAPIPLSTKVNGKFHNLQRRKHCLTCVPLNNGRGRWFGFVPKAPTVRAEEKRARMRKKYEARRTELGRCPVATVRIARKLTLQTLLGARCQLCGYDRCRRTLHFHHVDPAEKGFDLKITSFQMQLGTLLAEARKCILICANCHGELHDGLVDVERIAPLAAYVRNTIDGVAATSWREFCPDAPPLMARA